MAANTARDAFERKAWAEAYRALSAADAESPLGSGDLELFATSAFLIGKEEETIELWIRAHNECLRADDAPRAARCVFWLVNILLVRGELAQAGGWLARAHHQLDEGRHECPERGLLLVLNARLNHIKREDPERTDEIIGRAMEIARRFDDPDLATFSRLVLGQAHVRSGNAVEAVALFDEVMVAVTVGEASPIGIGFLYCAIIDACQQIFDVERAREWTAALSRMCAAQPDLVPFRGQCLVHRAEIMRFSGAWSQAIKEAEGACAALIRTPSSGAETAPEPIFIYPVGAAFYELGEIHRMRGELEEAEEAYRQASRSGQSPEPGLALLRMAQGRLNVAEATIRRVLGEPCSRLARARILAACVEIMVATRDLATARTAVDELAAIEAQLGSPFLRALGSQSLGAVLLAEGDARAGLVALRSAWMTWQELDAPYESARVRVLLAMACRSLGDEDAAELELDAARRVFQRLAAAPDVERVRSLMESSAQPTTSALTARELEVIGLVATGKTNRDIALALSISQRTVDRHVSNILLKLDLPSRSAATAYAFEHGLV
jgi:DNA-binding CsgD family transcriptional regulator